jgi:hypothetical protein
MIDRAINAYWTGMYRMGAALEAVFWTLADWTGRLGEFVWYDVPYWVARKVSRSYRE